MSSRDEFIASVANAMRTDPRLHKLQGYPELYNTYEKVLKYLLQDMIDHPEYSYVLLKVWGGCQKLCDEVLRYLSADAAAKPECFKEVLNAAYNLFLALVWCAEVWFKNGRTERVPKRRNSV